MGGCGCLLLLLAAAPASHIQAEHEEGQEVQGLMCQSSEGEQEPTSLPTGINIPLYIGHPDPAQGTGFIIPVHSPGHQVRS